MSREAKLEMGTSSPPPDYETAKNDSPPDYDSIFGRIQKAKDESTGNVDYAHKMVVMACCGTVCSIISMVMLFSIPIVNLVIGAVYLHDCPIERYIPIYLLVAGVFGIVKGILQVALMVAKKCKKDENDEDESKKNKVNPADQVLNCFLFAWFIAGSVWVYSNHDEVQFDDEGEKDYCHGICYRYAFWFLTISYIILGLFFLCCLSGVIVACVVACKSNKE